MSATTIAAALKEASRQIERLDAEVLLAHFLGTERLALMLTPDRQIEATGFAALVARRLAGEPVAHITGTREFWSLPFQVCSKVLIPRPDSETLIEAALALPPPGRVLDMGTGSGALLLSVLHERPEATGLGIDISADALAIAAANADALGLAARARFALGDWGQGLHESFDLILCNPPYVEDAAALSVEVRDHEPALALFGGVDGLDQYRRLLPGLPALLAAGGAAVLEIGNTQAAAVLALAGAAGLSGSIRRDLAGRDRALILRVVPASA